MTCNIGKTDKIIRVILGLTIIALGIYFKSWWGTVGIVPLITVAIGWCPAYFPLGISTCKSEEKER
jgi:hypothetical protein